MLLCILYPGTWFSISVYPIFSSTINSSATRHICAKSSAFIAMQPLHGSTVLFPNKSSILSFSLGISGVVLSYFWNVLFAPQFQLNLLSVSALAAASQFSFAFFLDHFIVQELHTKKTIRKGNKIGDLYMFNARTTNTALFISQTIFSVNTSAAHIGHLRWRYLSD